LGCRRLAQRAKRFRARSPLDVSEATREQLDVSLEAPVVDLVVPRFGNRPLGANISTSSTTWAMSILENIARIAEKATGWRRPDDLQSLSRELKPQTYRWTTVSSPIIPCGPSSSTRAPFDYRSASIPRPYLKSFLTAAGGGTRGGTGSTIMSTTIRASTRFWALRVAALGSDSEERKGALSTSGQKMWQSSRRVRATNVSTRAKIFLSSGLTRRRAPMTNARH
jgi:hypothetical protein